MSKFRAIHTWEDNIRFDSKKEAARYCELRTLLACKKISELKLQVIFQFWRACVEIDRWRVDFTYIENGKRVAEDPTGCMTGKKRRMIKLFEEQYPEWELRIS